MLLHIFIFRQKKLEKVMEEEGLKDEEVINIGKFSLQPGVAGRVLSSKCQPWCTGGRVAHGQRDV